MLQRAKHATSVRLMYCVVRLREQPRESSTMAAESTFDVDLSRAGEMRNGLLAEIGKLRELERVHWSPASHSWIVSQHQDIVEAFGGTLPLSNHKMDKSSFAELSPEESRRRLPNLTRYPQFWITESDPPNHTRLRKLLSKAF